MSVQFFQLSKLVEVVVSNDRNGRQQLVTAFCDRCTFTAPAAPTLQALINELVLVENWYKLGVNLGLQEHQLCEIEKKHHDNSHCKTEMLDHWLGNAKNPNWKALFDALCQMGEYTVALTIKTKYSIGTCLLFVVSYVW